MRKILLEMLCLLVLSSFVACNNSTEMKGDFDNAKPVTEVVNNITVTDEAPKVTTFSSKELILSTKSEDGSIVINITAIEDNSYNKIEKISVVENGVTINTINNVIGYYNDIYTLCPNTLKECL